MGSTLTLLESLHTAGQLQIWHMWESSHCR